MLFPATDIGQHFVNPKHYGGWKLAAPNMLISPVKCTNNSNFDQYYSTLWSPPSTTGAFVQSPAKPTKSQTETVPTFRKRIQFPDSSPKKLFRPWIDDHRRNDDETSDKSSLSSTVATVTTDASGSSRQLRQQQTNRFATTFNKVRQLADTLTSVQFDDDDTSKTTLELIATNLGKSTDGHRCIYCGKIYSRKYGLKIHLRTHTGFKPLKCKICHRPFGDPSNLNKHTRLHAESGAPLFQCHLCGKTLVRKRDLERHLNSRHPDDVEIDVERL